MHRAFLLVLPTTSSLLKYLILAVPSVFLCRYLESLEVFFIYFFLIFRSSLLSCLIILKLFFKYVSFYSLDFTLPKRRIFSKFQKRQDWQICANYNCLKIARKFLLSKVLANVSLTSFVNKTGKFNSDFYFVLHKASHNHHNICVCQIS